VFEAIRREGVVAVEEDDEFAGGLRDAEVAGGGGAQLLRRGVDQLKSRVRFDQRSGKAASGLVRAVVDDDGFVVAERLRGNARERLRQFRLAVVERNDD
jgi:hypothetical protein